ncbi:MAG: hypothetical protein MHM6MM_002928 [Cercozoa sp. M6MM]
MKRGAEKQLTDRNVHEADALVAEPGTFKRADPETLARRKMVQLKKPAAATAAPETSEKKEGAFSGLGVFNFGSSASSSSSSDSNAPAQPKFSFDFSKWASKPAEQKKDESKSDAKEGEKTETKPFAFSLNFGSTGKTDSSSTGGFSFGNLPKWTGPAKAEEQPAESESKAAATTKSKPKLEVREIQKSADAEDEVVIKDVVAKAHVLEEVEEEGDKKEDEKESEESKEKQLRWREMGAGMLAVKSFSNDKGDTFARVMIHNDKTGKLVLHTVASKLVSLEDVDNGKRLRLSTAEKDDKGETVLRTYMLRTKDPSKLAAVKSAIKTTVGLSE